MPFVYRLQKVLDFRIRKKEEQLLNVQKAQQQVYIAEENIRKNEAEIRQTIQNKNALKRTSKLRNVSRELPGGVRQQRHGTELISKQLAETKGVGGAGAWPLTDRRVSTVVRTCREPIFG